MSCADLAPCRSRCVPRKSGRDYTSPTHLTELDHLTVSLHMPQDDGLGHRPCRRGEQPRARGAARPFSLKTKIFAGVAGSLVRASSPPARGIVTRQGVRRCGAKKKECSIERSLLA